MKFRKKPVEVEAIKCKIAIMYASQMWRHLPDWLKEAYEKGDILFLAHPNRVEIKTLEGTMKADEDDWIIRGIKGEIYPCKPDIFESTYEPVKFVDVVR